MTQKEATSQGDKEQVRLWRWLAFATIATLVFGYVAAIDNVGCGNQIDSFLPLFEPWSSRSFEGQCLESQSWVLVGGMQKEPLKFLRMNDFGLVYEFPKPVWAIYSIKWRSEDVLLIGEEGGVRLVRLPEMKPLLSINLMDPSFRSLTNPRLLFNEEWLLIEGGGRLEDAEKSSTEVVGWKQSDLRSINTENPQPDFRERLTLDSRSEFFINIDPVNPILQLKRGDQVLNVNLETSESEYLQGVEGLPSKKFEHHYEGERKTNLQFSNWHVKEGTSKVIIDPRLLSCDEIEQLNYSIRFTHAERTHFPGLVSWRNSLLPSPLLLWWTVLFPSYFWLTFLCLAQLPYRYMQATNRLRILFLGSLTIGCYLLIATYLIGQRHFRLLAND